MKTASTVVRYLGFNTIKMMTTHCIVNDTTFSFHFRRPNSEDGKTLTDTGFASVWVNGESEKGGPDRFPMQPLSKIEKSTVKYLLEMMKIKKYAGDEDYVFAGGDRATCNECFCFAMVDTTDGMLDIIIGKKGRASIVETMLDSAHICIVDGMTSSVVDRAMLRFCKSYEAYMQFTTDIRNRFPLTKYEQIEDLVEKMPMEAVKDYLSAKSILDRTKIL